MKSSCALKQAARALRQNFTEESLPLLPFKAPRWTSKLRNRPREYIELVQSPTPIQEWNLTDVPDTFKVQVKRDDLTGHSGNKIRKLEFILADAVSKNSTCVVTCGGIQSNHCRATAIAANQLGLGCHLLVRNPTSDDAEEMQQSTSSANLLLCRAHGAETYLVPEEPLRSSLPSRLYRLAEELKKQGERPYVISQGGSDFFGTFGIIKSFIELMQQDVLERFDDIVVATSSGGTLAGLAVANCLTGEKLRVHGVTCSGKQKYIRKHVADTLLEYGLTRASPSQVCNIIDCSKWQGERGEDMNTVSEVCRETGLLLDYTKTLKGVRGMVKEMQENGRRFQGHRVLYIHTGGTVDDFDGLTYEKSSEGIRMWENIDENPLSI